MLIQEGVRELCYISLGSNTEVCKKPGKTVLECGGGNADFAKGIMTVDEQG